MTLVHLVILAPKTMRPSSSRVDIFGLLCSELANYEGNLYQLPKHIKHG